MTRFHLTRASYSTAPLSAIACALAIATAIQFAWGM